MPEVDPLQIRIEALDKATRVLRSIAVETKQLGKTSEKASNRVGKLGRSMKQLLVAAGLALTFRKIAQEMKEAVDIAVQAETQYTSLKLAVGDLADALVEELSVAARGTVADLDLMLAANRAMALGIAQSDLPELMEVARSRARVMGITVTQAFNDITTGIGRQSKLILDNLGIIVSLDAANQAYASTLGKTVEELTEYERKQALVNNVLESSQEIVEQQNQVLESNQDRIERTAAGFKNMQQEIGAELLPSFIEFQEILVENKDAIKDTALALADLVGVLAKVAVHLSKGASNLRLYKQNSEAVVESMKGDNGFVNVMLELAQMIPGADNALNRLGAETLGNLEQQFLSSGLSFQEFTDKMELTDQLAKMLQQRIGNELVDATEEQVEKQRMLNEAFEDSNVTLKEAVQLVRLGAVSIEALAAEIENAGTILQANPLTIEASIDEIKEALGLVDDLNAKLSGETEAKRDTKRLELLQAIIEQEKLLISEARAEAFEAGEAFTGSVGIAADDELARRLGLPDEDELRGFFQRFGITLTQIAGEAADSGELNVFGGGVSVERALERAKLREEEVELTKEIGGQLKKIEALEEELTEKKKAGAVATEAERVATVQAADTVEERIPVIITILEQKVEVQERAARAAEREALALERANRAIERRSTVSTLRR